MFLNAGVSNENPRPYVPVNSLKLYIYMSKPILLKKAENNEHRPTRLFLIAVVLTVLTCVETSRIACQSCEAGKYSDSIGATSPNTCQACTGNSTSVSASDSPNDCNCISGFSTTLAGASLICTVFTGAKWRSLFGFIMALCRFLRHGIWLRVDVGMYEPMIRPSLYQSLSCFPSTIAVFCFPSGIFGAN